MLAIKLKRIGKKHQASFRIIVAERRSKLNGRYVEDLGWLNPRSSEFNIKKERVEHWLKNGAQPTDTVHNLLVKAGVISGPKRAVHAKAKEKPAVAEEKTQPAAENTEEAPAPKEESIPAEQPVEQPAEKPMPEEKKEEKSVEEVPVDKE